MTLDFARYLNVRSATAPWLSPDGASVAFLSDMTGNQQVWRVSTAPDAMPLWPEQLTFFADKVWEIHGTPAVNHLVATSDVGGNECQQLYLITVDRPAAQGDANSVHSVRRLTTDDEAIHRFGAFSADGRQIVYTANVRNGTDFDPFWMDLMTGTRRRLAETTGNRLIVAWSEDGGQLLLLDAVASEQIELYVLDVASGRERHLTAAMAPARYHSITWTDYGLYVITDRERDRGAICRMNVEMAELTELVSADDLLSDFGGQTGEIDFDIVASSNTHAAFILNVEGYSRLHLLEFASGAYRHVANLPEGVIGALSFSQDGTRLVLDLQSPDRNADIWTVDLNTGSSRQLTFSNRAGIDAATFTTPQLIHYASFDERSIPAFYYRPQSAPPAGGYPCILYVHGGPAGQQHPDFDVRFQYFLQCGYALLVPNVRGSTGYGRDYMMLDDVDLRMDSVADLKYAVAWLDGREEIDSGRIAIYGRSYGGYMVLAALTEYPALFKAGIDVVGIANWVTFLERTSPWRRAHREREYGSLSQHRDLLEQISPIHKIERITMPLLVVAGDNDPRVPLYESEQVVARVRDAGGTVEFLHYADEGHKISKLTNRIDSFTRMAAFLDRYL